MIESDLRRANTMKNKLMNLRIASNRNLDGIKKTSREEFRNFFESRQNLLGYFAVTHRFTELVVWVLYHSVYFHSIF